LLLLLLHLSHEHQAPDDKLPPTLELLLQLVQLLLLVQWQLDVCQAQLAHQAALLLLAGCCGCMTDDTQESLASWGGWWCENEHKQAVALALLQVMCCVHCLVLRLLEICQQTRILLQRNVLLSCHIAYVIDREVCCHVS
jgi:hypothetical protein